MATNLNLDDSLIEAAVRLGRHRSKKEAVNKALETYVDQLRRLEALRALGSFDFDPDYDYKQARSA
ncbi:MAG: type II toxin-antitoxin system VapB family antitoxin [Armatimonadetes bacterium]|nr:type II toxin-antitoxin system VapB family antitoxin [Armatimonadota bacterium]